jgi:hypothetical protein
METENTHTENEMTNIKFIFEYDRDKDKTTPHKINKTKDLLKVLADYSFLNIAFSCGINSAKDTTCNFNTYLKKGVNIKDLKYKLFIIWGSYIYIENNQFNKFE